MLILALGTASLPVPCNAEDGLAGCAKIEDAEQRLACYDSIAGRPQTGNRRAPATGRAAAGPGTAPHAGGGNLEEAWQLDNRNAVGITNLKPYRHLYLIGRWTNNVNRLPDSPAPDHALAAPQDLNPTEIKFQLSAKSELLPPGFFSRLGSDKLRLWVAYTQQSHWQVLNRPDSRPFRETDYEPELILTYDNRLNAGHYGPQLVNVGFVHQSNGRANPESRSWNRLYLQGGWQWKDVPGLNGVSLLARGWWSGQKDDNPDINDYVGRADVAARFDLPGHGTFSVLARHNLRLNPGRGFLQLDWSLPSGLLLQLTSGYGESLIDYNHRQTTIGFGYSIWNW